MADEAPRPIIVRRRKKGGHAAHGGAWKIAYADFVTAMMAFFLLMWLLGSTAKGDLEGIAEYFKNPMRVSLTGGSGAGESSSIIKIGGGKDMTKADGQQRQGEEADQQKPYNLKSIEEEAERQEQLRLADLKQRLEALIEATPNLRAFRHQLLIDITSEGLRIQIVDDQNRPMFALGKADVQSYMRDILREIAKVLNGVTNRVSVAGHTDATPYAGGERGYSNWELSADRANASRRELIAGGIAEGKMLRIVGLGSAVMLDKNDPFSPVNRRMSIIVLNKRTESSIVAEGRTLDVSPEGVVSLRQIEATRVP